ncbi:nudix hydrolase 8 [Eurytemora carolleeae]|uniref:nudix hydrolase 8 n=1 Tax=Eurytemora carolleeae TaxID=1294199 RepID=UPI000C75C341|nr:nudix hydrolase 8 [Eurytemora carolleeae]|eukprot:XP_023346586.1 nudix hydrolase 8-like [Eurytemora affinis]
MKLCGSCKRLFVGLLEQSLSLVKSEIRLLSTNLTLMMDSSSGETNTLEIVNPGEIMNPEVRFKGTSDRFKCITISSVEEDFCPGSNFHQILDRSLLYWKKDMVRGVWFYVHPEHSAWIPHLVKQGFVFHHANTERLALYLWLDDKDRCQIPSYAHTLVGVGGMVINERDEILVVQERFYLSPHWKLPGGYVDPGEEIHEAAIREVMEETGVKTEFQ